MKTSYTLSHQLLAYIILLSSLFLQSCEASLNQPTPSTERSSNITQRLTSNQSEKKEQVTYVLLNTFSQLALTSKSHGDSSNQAIPNTDSSSNITQRLMSNPSGEKEQVTYDLLDSFSKKSKIYVHRSFCEIIYF